MPRGKCRFETMEMDKSITEDKGFWDTTRDPFAGAPDVEGGVMVPWHNQRGKDVKKRVSYYDRFRHPNKVYFQRMKVGGEGDLMEQEFGDVYVSSEEAFGKDPVIEDYSKEMNLGDVLNKSFEDD
jgi:hypothetical protein